MTLCILYILAFKTLLRTIAHSHCLECYSSNEAFGSSYSLRFGKHQYDKGKILNLNLSQKLSYSICKSALFHC